MKRTFATLGLIAAMFIAGASRGTDPPALNTDQSAMTAKVNNIDQLGLPTAPTLTGAAAEVYEYDIYIELPPPEPIIGAGADGLRQGLYDPGPAENATNFLMTNTNGAQNRGGTILDFTSDDVVMIAGASTDRHERTSGDFLGDNLGRDGPYPQSNTG